MKDRKRLLKWYENDKNENDDVCEIAKFTSHARFLVLNPTVLSSLPALFFPSSELPRKGKVNEFVFDDSFSPQVELWSLILCSIQIILNYFLRTSIKFNIQLIGSLQTLNLTITWCHYHVIVIITWFLWRGHTAGTPPVHRRIIAYISRAYS